MSFEAKNGGNPKLNAGVEGALIAMPATPSRITSAAVIAGIIMACGLYTGGVRASHARRDAQPTLKTRSF